jgi:hypothetical protein
MAMAVMWQVPESFKLSGFSVVFRVFWGEAELRMFLRLF